MNVLCGEEIKDYLEGLVYAKTQVGERWVDLTVSQIHHFKSRGSLDFGGSEFRAAETACLTPHKLKEDDKYGWWELSQGTYLVYYNEKLVKLSGSELAHVAPHPRLLAAGGSHPATYFTSEEALRVVISVPPEGLALKQNCRLSRLVFSR